MIRWRRRSVRAAATPRAVLAGLASRLGIERFKPREPSAAELAAVDLTGRVSFAVGTGRCGTTFLAQLLAREPAVAASHERDSLLETFHRYCKWHELPVDDAGFLYAMERAIRRDLVGRALSFESSCHLSLSMRELDQRFAPRFTLLVRHPRQVVKSHVGKGWYAAPVIQDRSGLALGYQPGKQFHHFLGRITPRAGEMDIAEWNALSQVGRLAWFWAALNRRVIEQAAAIPAERYRRYRLEDFDYDAYRELAGFLGFTPAVTAEGFADVRDSSAKKPARSVEWTPTEWAEFERFVAPLAAELGYDDLRAT